MAFISLLLTTAISSFSSLNYDGYFYQRENNNELLFLNNESSDSIENLISNNNIQTVATITVLVQGLNGSFVDYYHEIQGGYEIVENSIVDTLINGYRIDGVSGDSLTRGSNIYVFRNNEIRSLSNTSNTNLFSLSYIQPESIDISKPIILSYDGLTNQRSNEDCNNQFIDSLNRILVDIGNEMTHTYHCSDSLCNYQRDEAHLFEYISFESEHIKSCVVCGLSEEETHSYNVFISSGTMRHNIYCVCGKYHSSARHTYYAGSLECVYCGQINGTGGGTNPITPPHIME